MKLIRIENQKIGGGSPPGRTAGGNSAGAKTARKEQASVYDGLGQAKRLEERMKDTWRKFENSSVAGLVVAVIWCAMIIGYFWMASA